MKRAIFDADNHLMEALGRLGEFADDVLPKELEPLGLARPGSQERP